jgi:GAF domain-containing protein
MPPGPPAPAGSDETRLLLEQQAAEIERLRGRLADDRFAADLRDLLLATATTATLAAPAPHQDALRQIVATAVDVLDAQAAALFLLDEESDELVFAVALGGKAEEVKGFRLPIGRGIAGYVAATGQPIAVADAGADPRFAREIGEAVGYIPRTVLCVPLVLDGRVVGVLEVLDKAGGVTFSTRDMEVLGQFASLAALVVEQSRLTHDLRHLFRSLLGGLVKDGGLARPAQRFADHAAADSERADALRLAGLVHEIGRHGAAGRRLAFDLLTGLTRYLAANAAERGQG